MRVVIIGAGVMGAATAAFLAREPGVRVQWVEREPLFPRASSALSASSIRQQFSQPANIALSQWSLAFLRERSAAWGLGLVEPGYLYLAQTEAQAEGLRRKHAVQREAGADVALLDPAALAARFPWLNTTDLKLAALGLSGEGWFDGPGLHRAFRDEARAAGVGLHRGEAVDFETTADRVTALRLSEGQRLEAEVFVIAAGAWSAPLAAQLGVELPVSARKRDVFVVDTPAATPGCPLVIDPSGCWFRPEGAVMLMGAPPRDGDPPDVPLDAIDHGLFEDCIWPTLAERVPGFEAARVRSAWAGYYEMNAFDHNGLAGRLPGWANAYTACGFSGHGMQQAPAVGHSLAALITGRPAPLIEALTPQRLRDGRPLLEDNVI
jgi:glycine/D-amino acid oxidase-like deaminating enzyme